MSLAELYDQHVHVSNTGTHSLYCVYCDKSFRSFASYDSHMEREHQIKNGKRVKVKRSCVPEWEDKNDICDERCCGNSHTCLIL